MEKLLRKYFGCNIKIVFEKDKPAVYGVREEMTVKVNFCKISDVTYEQFMMYLIGLPIGKVSNIKAFQFRVKMLCEWRLRDTSQAFNIIKLFAILGIVNLIPDIMVRSLIYFPIIIAIDFMIQSVDFRECPITFTDLIVTT